MNIQVTYRRKSFDRKIVIPRVGVLPEEGKIICSGGSTFLIEADVVEKDIEL
ncbi:hypothetical protein CASFOL_021464 [Castilleja foliolosa]|uniref:Uncharacterized protein n=1 Tax=Castilleja foliolosa TaxID=1961234 RepID=A0ABD3CWM0_9LAMI